MCEAIEGPAGGLVVHERDGTATITTRVTFLVEDATTMAADERRLMKRIESLTERYLEKVHLAIEGAQTPCRYGRGCTRRDCYFQHDVDRETVAYEADRCYRCGEAGHWENDCSFKPRREEAVASAADRCYRCGEAGHWEKDCSFKPHLEEVNVSCYNCGEDGHVEMQCPELPAKLE